MEVIFAPEATHAEVAAIYPGARIEPVRYSVRRIANPAEAEELRTLRAVIFADADEADRTEALTVALADPEAALVCYRVLATHLRPLAPIKPDDRRTCEECGNLERPRGRDGFRRCAAARRGELPDVASRDYSPVPDVPRRCEGYAPTPDDRDRRWGP